MHLSYEAAVPTSTINDLTLRRGFVIMRWLIVAGYVTLARTGVVDISERALALSAGALVIYNLLFSWQRLYVARADPRMLTLIRYLDVAMVSIVLVALHDTRNPVWAVYIIALTSIAHLVTKREMTWYVVWIVANYAAAAAIIGAQGYYIPWAYVIVASVGILLMGMNAGLLAGGEQRLRDVIHQAATTDSLTGLPNRHYFHESYNQSLDAAMASDTPLALMLLDVDHFKEINDRDGHPAGDDKLRDVAQALGATMRRGDMVARYGGDEFIVVAPHATRDDALALAERLRESVARSSTSVSIGVAMFPDDAQKQDALIEAADAALYRAKQAGRNCVRHALAA
jgi:diguanylate cyclase (GGDEF)-like protein